MEARKHWVEEWLGTEKTRGRGNTHSKFSKKTFKRYNSSNNIYKLFAKHHAYCFIEIISYILHIILRVRSSYYSHFIDKEPEIVVNLLKVTQLMAEPQSDPRRNNSGVHILNQVLWVFSTVTHIKLYFNSPTLYTCIGMQINTEAKFYKIVLNS